MLELEFIFLRLCHFNEENDTFVALSVIIYPNNTDWAKKDVGQNFPLGVIHLFVYTHRHCLWRDQKQPKAFSYCCRNTLAFEIIHVSFYIKKLHDKWFIIENEECLKIAQQMTTWFIKNFTCQKIYVSCHPNILILKDYIEFSIVDTFI